MGAGKLRRKIRSWLQPGLMFMSSTFLSEPVGLCHTEEPLFLRYLEENSSAFNEFQVQLKKAGYDIHIDLDQKLLTFQAIDQPRELPELEKAFQSVRKKYTMHCETQEKILEVFIDHRSHINTFRSLRMYILNQLWFVGLLDEINGFLQWLTEEASQREQVCCEYVAEPLCWYTIAKDVVLQELLPIHPTINLEIIAKTPPAIRFSGSRRSVKEAEKHLVEVLNSFQILTVPFSNFQLQFVQAYWDKTFCNNFFLEMSIPVVLELSEAVQIAGLDLGIMKKAEEILTKLVHERAIEIAEDVKWATECSEWKQMLEQSLGTDKGITIHHVAPGWVILVGFSLVVIKVEKSIRAYLSENSQLEENVHLARPELVVAGEDLLHIMGWDRFRNVTFQVSSQPSVLQVGGLQKYVNKAMPIIMRDLESLVLDIIPVKNRAVREYIFGIGAGLLKNMALHMRCIARIKTEDSDDWKKILIEDTIKIRFDADFSQVICVLGKWGPVSSLKEVVVALLDQFYTKSICHEAIATFQNMNANQFLTDMSNKFPVDIRCLQNNEIQISGFPKDVEKVIKAVHTKIEEYQSEIIEVKAQYESVPYPVIKESLIQKRFPTNPSVSIEVLDYYPSTILFRGPRQKLVELRGQFEEFLSGFQFLSVSLSETQFRFLKEQWGKLFHSNFFLERNIPAILEVSEIVQIGGLSLGEIKEAENILMEQLCEKTVEIEDQLKWVTEEPEWEGLLQGLKSCEEVAVHYTPSNQVTVIGPPPQTAVVEESVKDYLRENSALEESMLLIKPELALVGESVFHITNWEHLKVNITFHQSHNRMSLQVKGLQKFVKVAIPVIQKDLDSLVSDMIPLEKKELCLYFSEEGADLLKDMAETQNCIARMQTQESSVGDSQGFAENHKAAIHVVGTQSKITSFKEHLSDFIAKFHKETICSAEMSAFSDDSLKDLCKTILTQYPVGFHRLKEKVVWIYGAPKDVDTVSEKIYGKLEKLLVAKIQKSEAEQTVAKLLFESIRWYHNSEAGWSAFDVMTNHHLEQEYGKKKTGTLMPWNGERLMINFLTGEGFIPDKRKFQIKREICLWDKNIAPFWEAMDECLVKKVELQTCSKEYQDVLKNFNMTAGNYNVVKIERIQNRYLWVSYCWKKSWMEKRNPEGIQNERILYHGTVPKNCSSVCDIGFKNAFRKQCIYGQGIYFSVAASSSVFYAKPDPQGLRYVFQARVLTGEYGYGSVNMVLPPMKRGGNGRYDSLVDLLHNPNIFVIFFDDHAYPEYLITFRS